jgi:hypothetical protein
MSEQSNVSWNCQKCGHSGTITTDTENLKSYWAYYSLLKEAHYEKTVGSCDFEPEKIHVSSVVHLIVKEGSTPK